MRRAVPSRGVSRQRKAAPRSSPSGGPARGLVVTICPRERGVVVIPVRPGEAARRMDAAALAQALRDLVTERRLDGPVQLCEACAGGCSRPGPNVGVTIYPPPRPGEKPDHVAIGWKTYVYSLTFLDCLATIIDENLYAPSPAPPLHGNSLS